MRIVYTGPLTPGSMSTARVDGLRELGHEVTTVDQRPFFRAGTFWSRLQGSLLIGPAVTAYEQTVITEVFATRPDLLFVDLAVYLRPPAVRQLRESGTTLLEYNTDYYGTQKHIFRHLKHTAYLYDLHVNTNIFNRDILLSWGSRKIVMTQFGYDPAEHFPVQPTDAERGRFACDVAFCGHREPFYEEMLRALKKSGLKLRVAGRKWVGADFLGKDEAVGYVTPAEYRAMICSARIAPTFLSKWNLNTCGTRTFEVVAMGAFLLGERTDEQVTYFKEGVEAEFFCSADELVHKAHQYCGNEVRRMRVAAAGRQRCLQSGYSLLERTRVMMEDIEKAKAH